MHYAILGLNLGFVLMVGLAMSNLIIELPKKNFLRKQLLNLNLIVFQAYNWVLVVVMLNFSGFGLKNGTFIAIMNIILIVFLGNAIEILEINVSFKLEDYLAQTRSFTSRLLYNYKLFIAIITGFDYFNEPLLLSYYIWTLLEYLKNPNFHSNFISRAYFSSLNFSIIAALAYYFIGINLISCKNFDLAYLLFFLGTIITKFSMKLLDFLINSKIEKILLNKGLIEVQDFQLSNREIYRNFIEAGEGNMNSRVLFLTFFANHQNSCKEKTCKCFEIQLKNKEDFIKYKKIFLGLLKFRFQDFLARCSEKDFPSIFLNFCSFLLTVLKTPSKVLNLLFAHRKRLKSMGDQLQAEILVKRAKKLLEKKLLNNDLYAQSLASVILFDKEVRHIEFRLKKIIQDMLKINDILLDDSQNTKKFIVLGREILKNLEKFKEKIMRLLDKNVKNVRLTQLAALTIKYLTEDLAFRNFYKQLNIKRINHMLSRKNHDSLDIFDHDSGIVFISLGQDFSTITKTSKNFLRILGFSDSSELLGKSLDFLMPKVFAMRHKELISDFVETGKGKLLISGLKSLFAVNKQGFLLEIKLLIRLDTIFHDEFVIAGYMKINKNVNNRTISMDIQGNLLNFTRDSDILFNFGLKNKDNIINMGIFLPEIIEKLFPMKKEDFQDKDILDFKQKGFALIPKKEELYTELISNGNFEILSGFSDIKSRDLEKENLANREKIYECLRKITTQDYRFYRIHYIMKTLSFAEKRLDIRILEILECFEVIEMKLFSQYLSRKTEKLRISLHKDNIDSPGSQQIHENTIKLKPEPSNTYNNQLSIERDLTIRESPNKKIKTIFNKDYSPSNSIQNDGNNQISHDNQILKAPNSNLLMPENPQIGSDSNKQTISASFEVEDSDFSLGLDNDMDFEQKISEISNNLANKLSSDDSLTHQDERTQTYQASQISRVSSHASGDAKKNTISGLMKGGGWNLAIFEMFGFGTLLGYIGITILMFELAREEGYNIQKTIENSGVFHDQLSPICVLLRDVQAYEWSYIGLSNNAFYLQEIQKSFEFSAGLLEDAYKIGIEETDASMDYIYTTYLTIKLKNITIYSDVASNGSILPMYSYTGANDIMYSYTGANDSLKTMIINIPQAIIFFLAASQHVYLGYALNQSQNVSDLENYHWFLKENILELITSMLTIFQINKAQRNDSLGYLQELNWMLILMISLLTFCLGASSAFFLIKNKVKCHKFCMLFWFFLENDLMERNTKLNSLLDRYFDQTKNTNFEKANYLTDPSVSQTGSTSKFKSLSKSFMRNDLKFDVLQKKRRGKLRRSNSLKTFKNWEFQRFFLVIMLIFLMFSGLIIGVYMIYYANTSLFIENTLDIMNDIDSVETYSITISIRYAMNSVILSLYDQTPDVVEETTAIISTLLVEIEDLQSTIIDFSTMFKNTGSSNILTDLKYEFFNEDLCLVAETLKSNADFAQMASLLGSQAFCDLLLKNILTKGSTSLAFSVNELFDDWQLLMNNSAYNEESLLEIIGSQDYLDTNLALAYVYSIGKYYSEEMLDKTSVYFDEIRTSNIIWIIFALLMIVVLFLMGFKKLMRNLREDLKENFSLILLFPFNVISGNKVLENKIAKMFRKQKI